MVLCSHETITVCGGLSAEGGPPVPRKSGGTTPGRAVSRAAFPGLQTPAHLHRSPRLTFRPSAR